LRILRGELFDAPIDTLQTHPMNANQGDVGAIHESIEANGFYGRALVQKSTGYILIGNHRFRAAVANGSDVLPVEVIDVDDATALRIMEADNAIAHKSTYDNEQRAYNLKTILEHFGTLTGSGADEADLDDILASIQKYKAGDVGEVDGWKTLGEQLVAKWSAAPAQIWQVPSVSTPGLFHRIMCSDVRSGTIAIDRLMDGRKARCLFTDPPYGVDYESDAHGKVEGDDVSPEELQQMLATAFSMAARATREDAGFYIWHASATRRAFERAMNSAGIEEKQYLIWAKESFVMGRADYHWQHEPCFYGQKQGSRAWFTEDRTQSTIWRITPRTRDNISSPEDVPVVLTNTTGVVITLDDGTDVYIGPIVPKGKKFRAVSIPDGASLTIVPAEGQSDLWHIRRDSQTDYLHPTQKPAALAARGIMNSTSPGDVVLDLFCGSGSTLVAAEQLGRMGYGMDKNPAAIAATLESLALIGLKPELVE
jgi:DNA modification methylase